MLNDRQKQWLQVAMSLRAAELHLENALEDWPQGGLPIDEKIMQSALRFITPAAANALFLVDGLEIIEDAPHVTAAEVQIVKENGQS